MTKPQLKLAEGIDAVIGGSSYAIFQRLDVETLTPTQTQSPAVERVPSPNQAPTALLSILQAIAGDGAVKCQQFQAAAWREKTRAEAVGTQPKRCFQLAPPYKHSSHKHQ